MHLLLNGMECVLHCIPQHQIPFELHHLRSIPFSHFCIAFGSDQGSVMHTQNINAKSQAYLARACSSSEVFVEKEREENGGKQTAK